MTIQAGKWDKFIIYKGATFDEVILWSDDCGDKIDLTGATAQMDCKYKITDASPFLTLNTSDSSIVITGGDGKINLLLTEVQTAALTAGKAVYDLRVTMPSGDVIFLLSGKITVMEMVTT
ncbi:hypothetical protein [uncultured Paraglaciecola sp.]|mgnify:CR=1 FL=1|uniref:hypothetical protein n=1 Tax=uncultured Paraglaciecola sp. TaxID=1765024 RepID=UPI0026125C0D|nr:hypothetical protein [uncultured Paraglaciecola sp.]